VTAVPATGYHFVQWSDGVLTATRTDTNVTANVSVTASFAINTYTLTYTAGANGTISGTSPQTVNFGASGTAVTAVANTGYHFVQWSDGVLTATRTDTNVTANVSVTASFAINATAPSFKQTASVSADTASTTIGQAFSTTVTVGDLIVAAVSWGNSSGLTCSDSQGNVYTTLPVQYDSTNNQSLGICYAANTKAGSTTVTATFSSSAPYRRLLVHEYAGLALTNPVDVTSANIANGTTAANGVTTTSATTTAAGRLVFAAVMDDAGTATIQAGTGFTQRAVLGSALASEDLVQATAGSIAGTWTFSVAHRYLARVVAFKSAGG
jgi:hypothetical protein